MKKAGYIIQNLNMEGLLLAISEHPCYKDSELLPLIKMMDISIQKLKKTKGELTDISKIQKSIEEDLQEIDIHEMLGEVFFSIKDYREK